MRDATARRKSAVQRIFGSRQLILLKGVCAMYGRTMSVIGS